jgi:hypothetical protein
LPGATSGAKKEAVRRGDMALEACRRNGAVLRSVLWAVAGKPIAG